MRAVLTVCLALLAVSVWGQDGWSKAHKRAFDDADFAFYQGDLAYAEEVFKVLHDEAPLTPALAWRLAACALERGDHSPTVKTWVDFAIVGGAVPGHYYLGRWLHLNYELEDAVDAYTRYQQSGHIDANRLQAGRYIDMCLFALQQVAHPADVLIENLGPGVNTEFQEYVPVIDGVGSELYFTSRRPNTTAGMTDPNGVPFEDIYFSELDGTIWGNAQGGGLSLNSETHDATVARSADGKQMLVYRTNPNLTGGDLYITYLKGGSWTTLKKLDDVINSAHQEPSACLSADGKILIFSSDRPGGYGGKDLYRVRMLPNGDWSLPKNLGPAINTEHDEDAPFLTADGASLYFASTGHLTMGGYDLFRSEVLEDDVWSPPSNLGYPVNTVGDDIYLTLDASGTIGYFSSARKGGFGGLDLYRVRFVERAKKFIVMHGEVMDEKGAPLQATLTVLDEQGQEIQGIYNSNAQSGKFILVLNPLITYKIFIESTGYSTVQDEIYLRPNGDALSETRMAPYILVQDP